MQVYNNFFFEKLECVTIDKIFVTNRVLIILNCDLMKCYWHNIEVLLELKKYVTQWNHSNIKNKNTNKMCYKET